MNSAALSIKVIRTSAEFAELRVEWNRLLENSPAFSVCLTWEWLYTWWKNYGSREFELHILMILDGKKLVGIAPFVLQCCSYRHVFSFRALRFLGTGEPEWEGVVSEYLDVIAQVGEQAGVASAIWAHLLHLRQWDQILLNDVLTDSLVMTELRRLITGDRQSLKLDLVGIRYWIELPHSVDEYAKLLDTSVAKRIAYKRRKLDRAGLVVVSRVVVPSELETAFAELVRLHALRWASEGRKGAFASSRFTAFHRQLAETFLVQGMLNIELLSVDGENIAVLYNFRYGDTEYFYQGGFDIVAAGKYSPGLVAHVFAIESAIRTGLKRYDFMRGTPNSYKAEFGCVQAEMHDMILFGNTVKGRILSATRRFVRVLRRAREILRGMLAH